MPGSDATANTWVDKNEPVLVSIMIQGATYVTYHLLCTRSETPRFVL